MATLNIAYAASGTLTITLASLATSADRTAGRESTAISNAVTLYDDVLVGGKITTGTSPTAAKQIDIYVYAGVNDTPLYPDVLDGTDSDETFTSVNVQATSIRLLRSISVDNTSDRTYWVAPTSIAALFGGIMPRNWGLFVTHDTAVSLNSNAANHLWSYTGCTFTSA